ncbi:uncharacterized protein EDB93DRAFT_1300036 [Suillus bovinus]|uniref:uncharacterized protein n=1 Tax=Suillus bovinus TaxID=48563 RepID=UPI001B873635|nr:uncharacterized protein EDB93DRAFT_1300036 [Suillus bovinus]KAG2138438.1 hypothetical protein EDB93DRAFT_1300036 [Suillus bovinus]
MLANHAITAQQGASPLPAPTLPSTPTLKPLSHNTPSQSETQGMQSSSIMTDFITEESPADSHPPPLSEPTPTEAAPPEPTSAPSKPTSAEAAPPEPTSAPSEPTSAEAAPPEPTSAEAASSGIATMPLIGSCSKRVRQISKCNEIANFIGLENTGSKKQGSSGVNGVHRKKQKKA